MKNYVLVVVFLFAAICVVAALATGITRVMAPVPGLPDNQSSEKLNKQGISADMPLGYLLPTSTMNSSTMQLAFVLRVIDGDTILVQIFDQAGDPAAQERVRYVGMDTPETVDPNKPVECYGHEASARNKQLVEGKYVLLKRDVSDRDKYGRLLRFVYLTNFSSSPIVAASTSVDLQLVQEGFARQLTIPPDVEDAAEFQAAASSAQAAHLGFWGACPSYPFTGE